MAYPKGKKNNKANWKRQSDARNEQILNMSNAVPSQVVNELYVKLNNEGCINRFKIVLQVCACKGYDLDKTIIELKRVFPYYLGDFFTKELLVDILKNHGDIAEAWGSFRDNEYKEQMLKNRAFEIAMKSDSINELLLYKEFTDGKTNVEQDKKPIFNFNLCKK